MGRVVVGGLVTTLVSLLAVFWFESQGTTVMGWYANHVIPAGAILVGFAASSGYGLASRWSGVKITRRVLAGVFALQVGAYFAACWLQFTAYGPVYGDGTAVSFATWFDVSTRTFAFVQRDGTVGDAYGVWGYAFRALEVSGFCLGSLLAPSKLRDASHCEPCSRYMRPARQALIPMSQDGLAAHDELQGLAEANDAAGFRERLKQVEITAKEAKRLDQCLELTLMRCSGCESGELRSLHRTIARLRMVSRLQGRSPLARFFARDASA